MLLKKIILLVCISLMAMIASAEELPKINIANAVYGFGEVLEGEQVKHDFVINNQGGASLKISNIVSDCGCTTTDFKAQTLKPGESAAVSATFDTTGFKGSKRKRIRIYTNDPKNPVASLIFEGRVFRDVEIDPPRIYFGKIKRGHAPEKTIKLIVEAKEKVKIIEIQSRSEFVTVDPVSTAEEDQSYVVKLSDKIPFGIFRSHLTVRTTSSKSPIINVPVFARVQGDLVTEPQDISFGLQAGPLEKDPQRTFILRNEGPHQLNVLSLKSANPNITAKIIGASILNPNGEVEIEVTLDGSTLGTVASKITIETNHPDSGQKKLDLPVYAIVSNKGE